jgi:4-hydroxy-tetrahydrodipicolinate synthase
VTPFHQDSSLDEATLRKLVQRQIREGIDFLVPCGTTGESPTLTPQEHSAVIDRTVQRAKGRVQVIAGTGSNATHEAVVTSQHAERAGVDAVMVVVPYYNRPTQEGLYRHFVEVARSVHVPVVVYNIPGRTGCDLAPETLARIAEAAPNVVATKEATGNVLRAQKIAQLMGPRMTVLSGDDALTLAMCAVGARGVISVTSNVLPAEVGRATRLALEGASAEARRAHLALLPVHEAMFLEASPAPVKAALALRGVIGDVVRGPLAPCTEGTRKLVAAALAAYAASTR